MRNAGASSFSFPFWNSLQDHEDGATEVTPYSALSTVSSDMHTADTFEDFCGDFGYDTDSRKAHATFELCRNFARRIKAFFTEEEITALEEIN